MNTKNRKLNRLLIQSLAIGSLTSLLVACGGKSSDPLSDYPEFKDYKPKTTETEVIVETPQPVEQPKTAEIPQELISTNIFQITADKDMNFTEGKTSSFKVYGRVFDPRVRFQLEASQLPQGATFTKSADAKEVNSWILTWTPPLGLVDANLNIKDFGFIVKLVPQQYPSAEAKENFEKIDKSINLSYRVSKPGDSPAIVSINGLPGTIEENQVVAFSVEVKDPAAFKAGLPRLDVYYTQIGNSAENYEANATSYIKQDANQILPVALNNGNWKFHYIFDSQNLEIPKQLIQHLKSQKTQSSSGQDFIKTRFTLKAISRTTTSSPEQIVHVNIRLKPQAPKMIGLSKMTSKVGSKISVQYATVNNSTLGSVVIDEQTLTEQVKQLPGQASLNCPADQKSDSYTCVVTWDIPCDNKLAKNYKLNVQAQHKMGDAEAVSKAETVIEVASSQCPAEKKP